MKYLQVLVCTVLITFLSTSTSAGEMHLPQRKSSYQNIKADPATLSEAKFILEQISFELQKSPESANPQNISKTPAPFPSSATATNSPRVAKPPTPGKLSISREGDINMACSQISSEALRMRDIIYRTQEVKDRAKIQNHGIAAAGAIGSFLIGSVTGGVGLAVGGFLLDQNIGKIEEEADNIQDTAAQRRTLMMGIYNAKGCEGPLEHAMQNPEIFDPLAKLAAIETSYGEENIPQYNE